MTDKSTIFTATTRIFCALTVLSLSACTVQETVYVRERPPAQPVYEHPVQSVYFEPPLWQPEPVRVAWAPPPLLVEVPPPPPFEGAVWIGGFWIWQGDWVWMHARWAQPPHPGYHYVHPYYEHRDGSIIFVNGFWAAADVHFNAPGLNININLSAPLPGVRVGPRPIGPEGVFVPPPPGSRYGVIVPCPIGTPPAVVTGAPPVINTGMRITSNINSNNTTVINNRTTIVNNYTIVAPANATSNGRAFAGAVPAQAHLAAGMPSVVHTPAPQLLTQLQQRPTQTPQVEPAVNPQVRNPVMNGHSANFPEASATQLRTPTVEANMHHKVDSEVRPGLGSPNPNKPFAAMPAPVDAHAKVFEGEQEARKREMEKIRQSKRAEEAQREVKKLESEKPDRRKRFEEAQQEAKKHEAEKLEDRKRLVEAQQDGKRVKN